MPRPGFERVGGHYVYQSLGQADETLFNGLTSLKARKRFCEMVIRWRENIEDGNENEPVDPGAIVHRWHTRGCRLKKVRYMQIPIAVIASPNQPAPAPVHPVASPPLAPLDIPSQGSPPSNVAHSPVQSPLLELSPRLMCESDNNGGILLSPTRGQADFIANDLQGPWKFADVIYQVEPEGSAPLDPSKSAHLFVRSGDNGIIEDQLVVKSLEINEIAREFGLQQANNDVQREVDIHHLLGLTQCSHIVRYRGHSVRAGHCDIIKPDDEEHEVKVYERKMVNLYQDFASSGNLRDVIDRHREQKRPINEHFIWYTLRELTEAMIALHKGPGHCTKPRNDASNLHVPGQYTALASDPWIPIFHLDFKSDNVFLESENNEYPEYPKPVLGDFGISRQGTEDVVALKHSKDLKGPHKSVPRFLGTDRWRSPERFIDYDAPISNPLYVPYEWELSGKSDVWTLGLLAHDMMYAYTDNPSSTLSNVYDWEKTFCDDEIGAHQSHFDAFTGDIDRLPENYSARLCLLTVKCLRHNIDFRPSLDELLVICQGELARLDTASRFTAGKRKRNDDDEDGLVLIGDPQTQNFGKYRIGEAYQPKRPRTRVDLSVGPRRVQHEQIVDEWSQMERVSLENEEIIINALDRRFIDNGVDSLDQHEHNWAFKHLISCLRKRLNPKGGAYILTHDYVHNNFGFESIDAVLDPRTQILVLEHLRGNEFLWNGTHGLGNQEARSVLDTLRNAIDWGLMILQDTSTLGDEGRPAEPREPSLKDPSNLHMGIYEWIHVRPTGAFYKT